MLVAVCWLRSRNFSVLWHGLLYLDRSLPGFPIVHGDSAGAWPATWRPAEETVKASSAAAAAVEKHGNTIDQHGRPRNEELFSFRWLCAKTVPSEYLSLWAYWETHYVAPPSPASAPTSRRDRRARPILPSRVVESTHFDRLWLRFRDVARGRFFPLSSTTPRFKTAGGRIETTPPPRVSAGVQWGGEGWAA